MNVDPIRLTRVTAVSAVPITPSDSDDLPSAFQAGLLVTVTGNVAIIDMLGNAVSFPAVPAYTRLPVVARRVKATGTTATLVGLN